MNNKQEKEKGLIVKDSLSFEDIDILASISSDICESVRDLIYNIKEIKGDVKIIKEKLKIK